MHDSGRKRQQKTDRKISNDKENHEQYAPKMATLWVER